MISLCQEIQVNVQDNFKNNLIFRVTEGVFLKFINHYHISVSAMVWNCCQFFLQLRLWTICVYVCYLHFYISDLWLNVWFRQVSRSSFILLNMAIKIITLKQKIPRSFKTVFLGIHGIRRLKRDNKVKIYPRIHRLKEVPCFKTRFCSRRGR